MLHVIYDNNMLDKEVSLKEIGLKIKALRKERNLTLMDFSVLSSIDYSNIARLEGGRTNLTIGTLVRIANALNVSLRELMP